MAHTSATDGQTPARLHHECPVSYGRRAHIPKPFALRPAADTLQRHFSSPRGATTQYTHAYINCNRTGFHCKLVFLFSPLRLTPLQPLTMQKSLAGAAQSLISQVQPAQRNHWSLSLVRRSEFTDVTALSAKSFWHLCSFRRPHSVSTVLFEA